METKTLNGGGRADGEAHRKWRGGGRGPVQKGEAGRKTLGASSSRGAGPSETLTATGLSQGGRGESLLEPRMFGIWGPVN